MKGYGLYFIFEEAIFIRIYSNGSKLTIYFFITKHTDSVIFVFKYLETMCYITKFLKPHQFLSYAVALIKLRVVDLNIDINKYLKKNKKKKDK